MTAPAAASPTMAPVNSAGHCRRRRRSPIRLLRDTGTCTDQPLGSSIPIHCLSRSAASGTCAQVLAATLSAHDSATFGVHVSAGLCCDVL